jgi:hypothetical protein
MGLLGYAAHGRGPLSPQSPELECRICHANLWTMDQLTDDMVCEECEEECICHSCGAETERTDHKCEHCY